MTLSTETATYTQTAQALHWLIALAIILMLAMGWSFDFIPKGEIQFFFLSLIHISEPTRPY